MAAFIYFGERFSSVQTEGNFGSFTCLETEMGVEWDAIQAALDRGEEVQVRQPTAAECAAMEDVLAYYRNTGGPANSLFDLRTYH